MHYFKNATIVPYASLRVKHLLGAVVTFKKLLHLQSSHTPVQDGSLNRTLLFNVPDSLFWPQYKRKRQSGYVRLSMKVMELRIIPIHFLRRNHLPTIPSYKV